ncbi:MAG: pyridoxamine 5'-phosphate oxidase family protein [Actinomycetota bacterium]|nr:pyridoxamine 5'-phosphate oxidase family protein [Actinomycetota bacterium]
MLATLRRDGTPRMSPVVATVDGQRRVVVSTRQTAFKGRNLRRDSRAWLYYYRRVSGEHPDWDDYRTAMERDQRVLLQIELISAGPDREG